MENVTHAIHLDKYQVKQDGTSALYMRLTINRKVKLLALNKYLKVEHFDFSKRRVKIIKELPNAKNINRFLVQKEMLIAEIILDLQNRNKPLSFNNIKQQFQNLGSKNYTNYCRAELLAELEGGLIKEVSYKVNLSKIIKVEEYQPNVSIYEIDEKWLLKYKQHLIQRGNNLNTIAGDFSVFRKFIARAKKQGITKYNPFENDVSIVRIQKEKAYLDMQELQELLTYYESDKLLNVKKKVKNKKYSIGEKYQEVIQHFLIGCFSGLRIGDIKTLRRSHFNFNENVIVKEMCKHRINKAKNVTIPITSQILRVLDIGVGELVYKSKVKGRREMNNNLRAALKIIGICKDKYITFHSSRHTFCVNSLTLGMPIETVQNVMGHSNLNTTLIYAKIVDSKRKKDMSVWDKFDELTKKQEALQEVA